MSRIVKREFLKTEILAKLASRRTHNVEDGFEVDLIQFFKGFSDGFSIGSPVYTPIEFYRRYLRPWKLRA